MKRIKNFFNPILVILLSILFIGVITSNDTLSNGFRIVRTLQEMIKTKPLNKKQFINFKNSKKIITKSYKGIIAGGGGIVFAANQIINFKRKKKSKENNLE